MYDYEACVRLLEGAKAEHGPEALRRLEQALRAAQGEGPAAAPDDPMQRPEWLYVPGLTAAPWHDRDRVPDLAILEANAPVFREELEQLLERRIGFQPFDEGPEGFNPMNTNAGWNVFYFRWGCQDVPANHTLCPRTSAVLKTLPNLGQSAMFSALKPGTHLEAHCGPTNVILTLSLGLIAPPGCEIRVGREPRTWQPGKCLCFDDSFEHEVWHRGTQTRFILLLDVWHPDLTPAERGVLAKALWSEEAAAETVAQHAQDLTGQQWW